MRMYCLHKQISIQKYLVATLTLILTLPMIVSAKIQDNCGQYEVNFYQKSAQEMFFSWQGFPGIPEPDRDQVFSLINPLQPKFLNKRARSNNLLFQITSDESEDNSASRTSLLTEIGYILAMETVFTGMSYLGSRDKGSGHLVAGGFDIAMGIAGIPNAKIQKSKAKSVGYYLISAGFIAKALYNIEYGKEYSRDTRFYTNFIGYNLLVFTGYFLDSLE